MIATPSSKSKRSTRVITAHQPNYLPWAGLFHKIAIADLHVVYDDVDFSRYGYSNRTRIRTRNGELMLTVPIRRPSLSGAELHKIEIDPNNERWHRKHMGSIANAYSKMAFYPNFAGRLEEIYACPWKRLVELNICILENFLDILGIATPVMRSSSLGLIGDKTERVIDLCRKVGAQSFIFGFGGRKYADLAALEASGIEPLFQTYRLPEYPSLLQPVNFPISLLDLLFHCGPESFNVVMRNQMTLDEVRRTSGDWVSSCLPGNQLKSC